MDTVMQDIIELETNQPTNDEIQEMHRHIMNKLVKKTRKFEIETLEQELEYLKGE